MNSEGSSSEPAILTTDWLVHVAMPSMLTWPSVAPVIAITVDRAGISLVDDDANAADVINSVGWMIGNLLISPELIQGIEPFVQNSAFVRDGVPPRYVLSSVPTVLIGHPSGTGPSS